MIAHPCGGTQFWLRALLTFVCLMAAACGGGEPSIALPESLEGGWARAELTSLDPASIPDALQRLKATGGERTTYTREGATVPVTVYRMPAAVSAFEALQTYPKAADEYYVHHGVSFAVVDVRELPPAERRPFLVSFQQAAAPRKADAEAE